MAVLFQKGRERHRRDSTLRIENLHATMFANFIYTNQIGQSALFRRDQRAFVTSDIRSKTACAAASVRVRPQTEAFDRVLSAN